MAARTRLIIGLDYGTTYSGVSFVKSDATGIDDIQVIRNWPGRDSEFKVPTKIAYADENAKAKLREDAWGFEVEPAMLSCSWTKLLLDQKSKDKTYDDPDLQKAIDAGMLRLSPGRSAQQVCSDFLKHLHDHLRTRLQKQADLAIWDAMPVDCWITVPAVWSDGARSATREAAIKAGFGYRLQDTINVISEPEAAAITALKEFMKPGALMPPKAGDNIMICDCGGGTVDVSTYTIRSTEPHFVFEELCVGIGGKCGSTYIDRNLQKLMHDRFGKAFLEIDLRRKGPGSKFMNTFEQVKRSFGRHGTQQTKEIGPLNMKGVPDSDFYDEEDGSVKLTMTDVESLFQPVVNQIIKLVSAQKAEAKKVGHGIDRLVLVGGFGDSHYLYDRLREWCKSNGGIDLICPTDPQAAIVRGAALRGLEGTKPDKKLCRKFYGTSMRLAFEEGIDPESRARYDRWDGRKMCRNRMDWVIDKGDAIKADTTRTLSFYFTRDVSQGFKDTLDLYACSSAVAPRYLEDSGIEFVGTINLDFSDVPKYKFPQKQIEGKLVYMLDCRCTISFGALSGTLEVKAIAQASETLVGTATLKFE